MNPIGKPEYPNRDNDGLWVVPIKMQS